MADLAGTYQYASDTLHSATKPVAKQGQVRRLILNGNGTFVASGVPVGDDNNTPVVIRAGSGMWSFRRPFEDDKHDQGIELDFASHGKVVESCFIALTHEKPPYDLIFIIGDFDEQDTVRYAKVQ